LQLYEDCWQKRARVLGGNHDDTNRARLSHSICQHKLSLQCCSVAFGLYSAAVSCALKGVRLLPPHVGPFNFSKLFCCFASEKAVTLEWRRRAISWGAVGLLCARMAAASSASDTHVTRVAASVAQRVVAARAAARYVA
jgi:hypothetical protein